MVKKLNLIDGTVLYIDPSVINGVIIDKENNRVSVICGEQRLQVNTANIEDKEKFVEELFIKSSL